MDIVRKKINPEVLAKGRSNVVISKLHGIRIGNNQILSQKHIPFGVKSWLDHEKLEEILISARHFDKSQWSESLEDDLFPHNLINNGGNIFRRVIKFLFVNSFDPKIKFIYPYRPVEHFSSVLLSTTNVDACVYDPNLESKEIGRNYPDNQLNLFTVLKAERFDVIVQTIFNVDHDLRILGAMKQISSGSLFIIGGPHLNAIDPDIYFKALPVDGIIFGDGENPLVSLADRFHDNIELSRIPGIITRMKLKSFSKSKFELKAIPSFLKKRDDELIVPHEFNKNIWGLMAYSKRRNVLSDLGQPVLPFDIIGLKPLRVLTSQNCNKVCYWCKAPKKLAPQDPELIIDEIKNHFHSYDSIHFEDNDVWVSPDNFQKIGEQMICSGLNSKPILVKTSTDKMTIDRAKFMYEMGVRIIAFGVESFDQQLLDLLNKKTTAKQNHFAISVTLENKMKPGINAIWLVPGINIIKTKHLIYSLIPYLKRGAYLNLVQELEMGDIKLTRRINKLISEGYFRNEPIFFDGMSAPLDFLVLNLSEEMVNYKIMVLTEMLKHNDTDRELYLRKHSSVAVSSLYLLYSMVKVFPDQQLITPDQKSEILNELEKLIFQVGYREEHHQLFL